MNKRTIGYNLNRPRREFAAKAGSVGFKNKIVLNQIYKVSLRELQLKSILHFSQDCLRYIEKPILNEHLLLLAEFDFLKLLQTPKVIVKITPEQTFKDTSKIFQSFIMFAVPPNNSDTINPNNQKFIPLQMNLVKNKNGNEYDYSISVYALNTKIPTNNKKAIYIPLLRLDLTTGFPHKNYDGNITELFHIHFATYENIVTAANNSCEHDARQFCIHPYAISPDLTGAKNTLENLSKIPLGVSLQFMLDILNVQNTYIKNFETPSVSVDNLPLSTIFTKPSQLKTLFSGLTMRPPIFLDSIKNIKDNISAFSEHICSLINEACPLNLEI